MQKLTLQIFKSLYEQLSFEDTKEFVKTVILKEDILPKAKCSNLHPKRSGHASSAIIWLIYRLNILNCDCNIDFGDTSISGTLNQDLWGLPKGTHVFIYCNCYKDGIYTMYDFKKLNIKYSSKKYVDEFTSVEDVERWYDQPFVKEMEREINLLI